MKTHQLKIDEKWLDRIRPGEKTCELRIKDRDYQTGDEILFMRLLPKDEILSSDEYYVREGDKTYLLYKDEPYKITHVLAGVEGLEKDYCILSLKPKKK